MIAPYQTNHLHLSGLLPEQHPDFCASLQEKLSDRNLKIDFLPHTKGIWAADFMPLQISRDRFVQFQYAPKYLRTNALSSTITNVADVCAEMGLELRKSEIVLDGGNVVRSENRVILTERVFADNPSYQRSRLLSELRDLLETEQLHLIPEIPADQTGHASSMVRFLNDDTLLVSDFSKESKRFQSDFQAALSDLKLETVAIPLNPYNNRHSYGQQGVYINFLQLDGIVLLPVFGQPEDDMMLRTCEGLFVGEVVQEIDCAEIGEIGGSLKRLSWCTWD